jgi:hypothetical protein
MPPFEREEVGADILKRSQSLGGYSCEALLDIGD